MERKVCAVLLYVISLLAILATLLSAWTWCCMRAHMEMNEMVETSTEKGDVSGAI